MSRLAHFEKLFEGSPDPWRTLHSDYESRKADIALAVLPRRHYEFAFDPACGVGAFARKLADRAARLLASDFAPAAVAAATKLLSGFSHAQVRTLSIPDDWPEEPFDLVVFGEILYYLEPDELSATLALGARLRSTADILSIHACSEFGDRAISAKDLRRLMLEAWGEPDACYRESLFEVDVWSATGLPQP